jgi:hypothetical protein
MKEQMPEDNLIKNNEANLVPSSNVDSSLEELVTKSASFHEDSLNPMERNPVIYTTKTADSDGDSNSGENTSENNIHESLASKQDEFITQQLPLNSQTIADSDQTKPRSDSSESLTYSQGGFSDQELSSAYKAIIEEVDSAQITPENNINEFITQQLPSDLQVIPYDQII